MSTHDMEGRKSPPDSALDPDSETIRRMGTATVNVVADYLGRIRDKRVMPLTTSEKVLSQLDDELPVTGVEFDALLKTIETVVFPLSRHNGHPRFFGYVASPGTAATALADLLASALNPTVTSWRSAPAAAELERLVIGWICRILELPDSFDGLFVSGGSIANFSALAVARNESVNADVVQRGMQAATKPLRAYISVDGHHSSVKAAALLGIGSDNVRPIAVNESHEMQVADLVHCIESDIAAGFQPFCVIGSAGTTMTGSVDPLGEIADVAFRFGLWFHVDACYGGFAAMVPALRSRFSGIDRADSVALDPHKWLYVPGDCGCILYRDPDKARATFGDDADYIRVIGQQPAESFAFWDYGPELTRRFRALKVWMMIANVGTRQLAAAIESNCDCAMHFGAQVAQATDFELLAPVGLSVFCFRYVPGALQNGSGKRSDADIAYLNELNERILSRLQRDGSSYLSNARINEQFALRGCVLNFRTTKNDMDVLLRDVRLAAESVQSD